MNIKVSTIFFIVMVTGLFSCKNKDLPPPVGTKTPLNVINATGDTLSFFVNGTRQNDFTPLYPGGAVGYINTLTDAQSYSLKKSGSAVVLYTIPLQNKLDTGRDYSLFIGGESPGETFLKLDSLGMAVYILSADTTFSTCMIRFVNATASATTLTVALSDSGKVVRNIPNSAFMYDSPFFRIKAGGQQEVKVYPNGSGTPQVDTTFTLQTGFIYTIFSKGSLNGKGSSAFGIGLMTNYQ